MADWPVAELRPIARAKALAAAIPSAAWVEGVLDAPYQDTWAWVTDLETSVPLFDSQVSRIRVLERAPVPGEDGVVQIRMKATTFRTTWPFEVRVEDGFCLMRGFARLYLVVMAAEPEDGGKKTRFLHMEAVPLPGTARLLPRIRREVHHDFANLAEIARRDFSA